MRSSKKEEGLNEFASAIHRYVETSQGLEIKADSHEVVCISQRIDKKTIEFPTNSVEEVISRKDTDGQDFLQVNFVNGHKILITQNLVGFKPAPNKGLDLQKLPRVVTTPDLVSVVDAIEDSLSQDESRDDEVAVLKKVFDSVLRGGEAVGFDLETEKKWLQRLIPSRGKHSA